MAQNEQNYGAGRSLLSGLKRSYTGGVSGDVHTLLGRLNFAAKLA